MLVDVDADFIYPLEEHYETEPKDSIRGYIRSHLEGFSKEELDAGVEWLKANRQSVTSFPSPKECRRACEEGIADQRRRAANQRNDGVSALDYKSRAAAVVASQKRCFTIRPGDLAWDKWFAYFQENGLEKSLKSMEAIERGASALGESYAVPKLFPEQFDPKFSPVNIPARNVRPAEDQQRVRTDFEKVLMSERLLRIKRTPFMGGEDHAVRDGVVKRVWLQFYDSFEAKNSDPRGFAETLAHELGFNRDNRAKGEAA